MIFIVTYIIGDVPELTEYTIPVECESQDTLTQMLANAIEDKADQHTRYMELCDTEPNMADFRVPQEWLNNPHVKERVAVHEELLGPIKVSNRYLSGLQDVADVSEIEVIPFEVWLASFEQADAQEDARRYAAQGGKVN
jgi:hypothetical protein